MSTNDAFDIVIAKAPLSVTADDNSRGYAETNPLLTFSYSSFVLGENSSVLDTPPVADTTATNGSVVGSYPITLGGGADDHYEFSYLSGTLSVTITFVHHGRQHQPDLRRFESKFHGHAYRRSQRRHYHSRLQHLG